MRRIRAAALAAAVILIVPLLCFAGGTSFQRIPGVSGALRQYNGRRQAYYGPDSSFAGAGGFKPGEVLAATALFREGDSIYVDLSYYGMKRRCVYFSASALEDGSVGYAELNHPREADLPQAVQPMLGPGTDYCPLEQKTENSVRQSVGLPAGTKILALVQMKGWVFAEFSCTLGRVRAWIPAESVRCGEDIDAVTLDVPAEKDSLKPVFMNLPSAESGPGICPVCGGVREAILTVSYMQYDGRGHKRGPVEVDECRSCRRQFFLGAEEAPGEPHEFEGSTCVSCGFVQGSDIPCTGCGGSMIPMEEYRAVPDSDESHRIVHYRYYECRKCGQSTEPGEEDLQENEEHQFDSGGNCVYCMYHDFGK